MSCPEGMLMRDRVMGWIHSKAMENPPCAYKMSASAEATMTSSLMALHIRSLYGDAQHMCHSERTAWIDFINHQQEAESGLFRGFDTERQASCGEKYDADFIAHDNTYIGLAALDILNAKPRYPLTFLEEWLDPARVKDYVLGRNWADPWFSTDLIFDDFCAMTYDMEQSADQGRHRRAFQVLFDTLDTLQDPDTGFWGPNQGADPHESMAGTWHLFIIYNYHGRRMKFPERIIDNTLVLQGIDGHMAPPERRFATCFDMDATDLLVNLYRQVDYRRQDIRPCLSHLLEANLRLQNPDGGFRPSRSDAAHTVWEMSPSIKNPLPGESDMQATWFRSLVIALICQILSEHPMASIPWRFNQKLCLGWFR